MIRTFSVWRCKGTPEITDKIYDYPNFIGDRLFAKIVSAYYEDVVDYLKHCEFDPEITIAITGGVIIPKIRLTAYVKKSNKDKFISLLEILDKKFNWRVAAIIINGNELTSTYFDDISTGVNLIDNLIEFDIKPISFDATKVTKTAPEFDYNKYNKKIYLFHVTDRSNLDSILKSGLIPRESITGRFTYGPLVHLLRYLDGNIVRLINGRLYVTKNLRIKDPVLLKIGPMKNIDIDLFIDPSAPLDGAITSEVISPEFISLVNNTEYKHYFTEYKLPKDSKLIKYLGII